MRLVALGKCHVKINELECVIEYSAKQAANNGAIWLGSLYPVGDTKKEAVSEGALSSFLHRVMTNRKEFTALANKARIFCRGPKLGAKLSALEGSNRDRVNFHSK